jgi:hypothetical protein
MPATALKASNEAQDRRVLAFPRCPTAERIAAARTLDASERRELDRLRWLALRAQLAPRSDLERACYLLAGTRDVSLERYASVFFHGLSATSTSDMTFYRPGAVAVSDDECWLLRLVAAHRQGEDAAAGALVAWRVTPRSRRWMRFLAHGLVRALDA